jgi:hypothetical protein
LCLSGGSDDPDTRYKAKLPRWLSYPIGAEALSEGLTGAPHIESMSVWFSGKPVWPDSLFQEALAREHPYKVVVAEYRPARKPGYGGAQFLVESGEYDEQWRLTVYPVIGELRHLTNRLLRERGLPLIVQWLRSSERAGWLARHQSIELVFNPAAETLSARESSEG